MLFKPKNQKIQLRYESFKSIFDLNRNLIL